jgi:hypothetical protein
VFPNRLRLLSWASACSRSSVWLGADKLEKIGGRRETTSAAAIENTILAVVVGAFD